MRSLWQLQVRNERESTKFLPIRELWMSFAIRELCMSFAITEKKDSPTMPNKTQYMAANIGKGMDAKKAPNLPEKYGKCDDNEEHVGKSNKIRERKENKPKMEKKIMNAVDICTTLLLPMCVSPRRPTFSLQHHHSQVS